MHCTIIDINTTNEKQTADQGRIELARQHQPRSKSLK